MNKLEGYEKVDLIWDLKLHTELLHGYLEKIYELQQYGENVDLSKVENWDLNGSIRYIKKLNSQKIGIKNLKGLLLDEQDRRKNSGIWNSRNS